MLKKAPKFYTEKVLDFEKKMLMKKISDMKDLPTPNPTIIRVIQLLRNEDISMQELIEAISRDQALVAKILKIINSGYYGMRKEIDSVERAVNLLGILKIKQVVYSASIMDFFSKEEEEEWNHAYSASLLMSGIMTEYMLPAASNLPLTVLMHDLGKVVLRRFSSQKYKMAVQMSKEERMPLNEAEDAIIKINHAEVGGWLLEKWQMTEDIYKPVMFHHSDTTPEDSIVETALLQFVDWVDCSARDIPTRRPSKELMHEAGFEEMETDYWINCQRSLIREIESQDKKTEEETKTRKLM